MTATEKSHIVSKVNHHENYAQCFPYIGDRAAQIPAKSWGSHDAGVHTMPPVRCRNPTAAEVHQRLSEIRPGSSGCLPQCKAGMHKRWQTVAKPGKNPVKTWPVNSMLAPRKVGKYENPRLNATGTPTNSKQIMNVMNTGQITQPPFHSRLEAVQD